MADVQTALPQTIDHSAILGVLAGKRFPLENEKALQAAMAATLEAAFEGFVFREHKLVGGVIDFVVVNCPGFGATGIEVKIGGSARDIHRQIVAYAVDPHLTSLILATSKAMALPPAIIGKRVTVFDLGRAWL